MSGDLVLVVRRTIRAPATRLFDAWTQPELLRRWFGPRPVTCCGAEVDLRVGGAYRIGNAMPDGSVLWIAGEFEVVEPPHRLVYSWMIEREGTLARSAAEGRSGSLEREGTLARSAAEGRSGSIEHAEPAERSRVTVKFEPRGEATEVVIVHEQIRDAPTRAGHEQGWIGCLDGLERLVDETAV